MAFEQNPVLRNLAYGKYGKESPQNLPRSGVRALSNPQQQSQGFLGRLGQGISNFFGGQGPQEFYSTPYSQNQEQGFNSLLQMGLKNQQDPYAGFDPIQKQIMDQFYNEVIPNISARFTGETGGALSSGSLAQQLGTASQGLQSMLAAHRAQFGQNQQQFGLQQAQLGLTPQYQTAFQQQQPGFLQQLLQLAPSAVKAYGAYNKASMPTDALTKLLSLIQGGGQNGTSVS